MLADELERDRAGAGRHVEHDIVGAGIRRARRGTASQAGSCPKESRRA